MSDQAYNIEEAPFTDAGFSDEFNSTTLAPQWTVVSGSPGTIGLLKDAASDVYDLNTRPGDLLMQPAEGSAVNTRLDAIPADGEQFVIAFTVGGTAGDDNNEFQFEAFFNDDNSAPNAGTFFQLYYDGQDNGNLKIFDGSVQITAEKAGVQCRRIYFRFVRSGGNIYSMYSVNGAIWRILDVRSVGTFTNFWIETNSGSGDHIIDGVAAVHWFRHTVYNGFDAF